MADQEGNDQGPEQRLAAVRKTHRLLLLFAPYREFGALQWQQQTLAAHSASLVSRGVALVSIIGRDEGYLDGEPLQLDSIESLRDELEAPDERFVMILLDRDGREVLRRSKSMRLNELFKLIDGLPDPSAIGGDAKRE